MSSNNIKLESTEAIRIINSETFETSPFLKGLEDENKKFLHDYHVNCLTDTFSVKNNIIFYIAGVRSFFHLTEKDEDKEKIWNNFNLSDFINRINKNVALIEIVGKYLQETDCETEVLQLIVKDYYKSLVYMVKREDGKAD